ncbi:MAG: restriction endonuclease subunit S, partial [Bacillota bacterium]|nr:restriction endonuclease subunit S [Bacillota bacterium]
MTYEIKYRDKEEMKDSGIEWINEIPYNWEIKKVKHTSKLITGDSISASDKDQYYSEELNDYYQYVGTKDIDVNTNQIDYNNDLYIPLKNSFNIANPNTFFICIEGGSAGRKIAYNNSKVCYVNKLCNIETKKGYSNKLLYYIFQSKEFTTQFNIKTTGIIPGIST